MIRFGFVGGENTFKEFPDQTGKTGETAFQVRGGDRVWKAPEDPIATWCPDNVSVTVEIIAKLACVDACSGAGVESQVGSNPGLLVDCVGYSDRTFRLQKCAKKGYPLFHDGGFSQWYSINAMASASNGST